MKLVDLNPRWVRVYPDRTGCGVIFDCPGACCAGKPSRVVDAWDDRTDDGCKERLHVLFRNPLDGNPLPGEPRWQREGETFETLTLTPSVDASAFGHWHGFVRNGETA